ncbi:MAG: ParB/RepB/Spo0J family partition protein [Chloroflexi bacterium]|nr:ParB/RepB/Spo0J family partition protein [Chloroflexota bacterium]MCL5950301.1 ParB/RepB/Spo0J family partition protein [Chloroflexota bacterium]
MTEPQMTAIAIPVHQVRPDPEQPRHLLPPDLTQALAERESPQEILDQLRERAKRDKWIRERLTELDSLADSIAADGLIQPIRVFQDAEDRYRIESGERRWWAHQILVGRGEARFETISAFIIPRIMEDTAVLRRRVAENVFRSDFTALEMARAMATRKEEIAAAEPGLSRRDIEKKVGQENGMSDRRVRQFLALLKLHPDVQQMAQQARLGESQLRTVVGIKEPIRQVAAVQGIIHPAKKEAHQSEIPSITRQAEKTRPKVNRRARPRARRKPLDISRLIVWAKDLQPRNTDKLVRELRGHLAKNAPEREAISCLREVLDRGLSGTSDS